MKVVYRICFLLIFTNHLGLSQSSPLTNLLSQGYQLSWSDEFDSFSNTFWTKNLQDSTTGHLVPGAHGAYLLNDRYDAYYTPEDVYIEDRCLILRNQKRTIQGTDPTGVFHYSSGWVMSMHKVFFTEGYLEFRAQFPHGDKVWPAIWLIPEDLTWCPEWDLFEYFGYRNELGFDQMGMHLCFDPYPDQQWKDYFIPNFHQVYNNSTWHIYGFLWTPDEAIWYLDGQEVRRLSAKNIVGWPDQDMYIVLNNGTRTESPDNTTQWPNFLKIDYIRLYQK